MRASKRSSQLHLIKLLHTLLLPDCEIIEEYKSSELTFPETSLPIELDVFVPKLNIAFEYQGKQHYEDTMLFGLAEQYRGTFDLPISSPYLWISSLTFSIQFIVISSTSHTNDPIERDDAKRKLCQASNITLIEIPYWWRGDEASLRATIAKVRPDVLHSLPDSDSKLVTYQNA